jgi:response regulator of citrate/malate metabolism
VIKAEQSLKDYVAVKNKLHKDRYAMQDHKDQLTEQLMHIETNCQLLDNRN